MHLLTVNRRRFRAFLAAAVLFVSLSAGMAVSSNTPASAAYGCGNFVALDVFTPPIGSVKWWLTTHCSFLTNTHQVRGVLDCRWAPDPKTSWMSQAPVSSSAWLPCVGVYSYRGHRLDVRGG